MKPTAKYLLLFLVLNINTFLYCQDFWEEVFASGPTIFSMDISDDGVIYLGAANGIWKSFDNGNNWEFDTISPGNLVVYSLETKPDGIVYAGCNSHIYFSEDFGSNWELIYDEYIVSNITSLCCINDIILAGTWHGILKSTDNGLAWSHVLELYGSESITSIVKGENDYYYAGSTGHLSLDSAGLYMSDNNGNSWSHIEPTYHYGVKDITLNNSGEVIAAVIWDPGWILGGIYEYDTGENTWQELRYGERGSAIIVNKIDDYYAGVDNELGNGGCRVSYDNGETWEIINSGLSNKHIKIIEIAPDGFLFSVANSPSIVFRSIEPTYTNTAELKKTETSFTIFPNPFRNETSLFAKTNLNTKITFELLDFKGNQIFLNNIFTIKGKVEILDIEDIKLLKGIYFYIVRGNHSKLYSGKLIVL